MDKFRAVILDVDGTLLDSNDAHARAWVEAFSDAGVQVEYGEVRSRIGMGGDHLMREVAAISAESREGNKIEARRAEIFKEKYLPNLKPFLRVRELLERFIDDGYRLAVASSSKAEDLGTLLAAAGIDDLLALPKNRTAVPSKPDPDLVERALGELGIEAKDAVMIGDTPYDVEAAERAGVRIVGLECGGWSDRDLAGAIAVYRDASDMLDKYATSPLVI